VPPVEELRPNVIRKLDAPLAPATSSAPATNIKAIVLPETPQQKAENARAIEISSLWKTTCQEAGKHEKDYFAFRQMLKVFDEEFEKYKNNGGRSDIVALIEQRDQSWIKTILSADRKSLELNGWSFDRLKSVRYSSNIVAANLDKLPEMTKYELNDANVMYRNWIISELSPPVGSDRANKYKANFASVVADVPNAGISPEILLLKYDVFKNLKSVSANWSQLQIDMQDEFAKLATELNRTHKKPLKKEELLATQEYQNWEAERVAKWEDFFISCIFDVHRGIEQHMKEATKGLDENTKKVVMKQYEGLLLATKYQDIYLKSGGREDVYIETFKAVAAKEELDSASLSRQILGDAMVDLRNEYANSPRYPKKGERVKSMLSAMEKHFGKSIIDSLLTIDNDLEAINSTPGGY
jgi:hypothetical protein